MIMTMTYKSKTKVVEILTIYCTGKVERERKLS